MDGVGLIPILPLVLIGMIALIVGGLIGALVAGGFRGDSPRKEKKPGKYSSKILSLWRDRKSGMLLIEMDDAYFPAAGQMTARRQAGMWKLMEELQTWIGSPSSEKLSLDLPNTEAPVPSSVPTPAKEPSPTLISLNPGNTANAIGLGTVNSTTVKPPSMELSDIIGGVLKSGSKTTSSPISELKSIAAQVDEILQERISGSSLRNRSIRLVDGASHELIVLVDGRSYPVVNEVPDPEVRALIQHCVADWEKRI